jgi:hypothetical protein
LEATVTLNRVTIGVLLFACACNVPAKKDKRAISAADYFADLDNEIREISPHLALLGMLTIKEKRGPCHMAAAAEEALRRVPLPTPAASDPPKTEMERVLDDVLSGRKDKILCEALSQADAERVAVFTIVKQQRVVPSGLHTFHLLQPADDTEDAGQPHYWEVEIGPIRTLETCQKIEALLRAEALPTRACRPWHPVETS